MEQQMAGDRGGNVVHTKGALAGSENNIYFNIANVITWTIDGVYNAHAAYTNQAFSSGHTALAAGQSCIFAVWVDSAGTVSTTQGKIVSTIDLNVTGGKGALTVPYPDVVASKALVGLIKVESTIASAATFTPNTTAMNATNITTTYYDCARMPSVPLTS